MDSVDPSAPSPQANNQSLGIDRKIGVPKLPSADEQFSESSTERRYRLQDIARHVMNNRDGRLQRCLRARLPEAATVEVRRNPATSSAHFRGLEVCSRVWTCPVCSARITNQRREELSKALAAAKLAGYFPILVTYTLRHSHRQKLEIVMDALQGALRRFKSGRAYQDIKDEYSLLGGIRALEITYGENGWHPHIHELLFLEKPISDMQIGGLKKWYFERWQATLQRVGFDASFQHGIDIRTANSDIADYIAKYGREPLEQGWSVEHELAKAPSKSAHRDGLTPFQLLESHDYGDDRAGQLFIEYATVMQNKRQLVWSAGLRKLLQLPDELLDEQLPLIDETPEIETVIELDGKAWARCCWGGIRGEILFHAAAADYTGLRALFRRYEVQATVIEPSPPKCDALLVTVEPPLQLQLLDAPVKFEYR